MTELEIALSDCRSMDRWLEDTDANDIMDAIQAYAAKSVQPDSGPMPWRLQGAFMLLASGEWDEQTEDTILRAIDAMIRTHKETNK